MNEIALALGGGGVRGIAHLGAIYYLENEGFNIGAIAGTSAGGLFGAIYSAGYEKDEIVDVLNNISQRNIFHRKPGDGPSLLGIQGLSETLLGLLGDRSFNDLKIPFACTAVDIKTGQEIILTQGPIVEAILATIAVPGIFPPKMIGDSLLVNGGVLDPVPVALARWLAPSLPIIAICLSSLPGGWSSPSFMHIPSSTTIPKPILEQFARLRIAQALDIFIRSLETGSRMLSELRLQVDRPDVIIRPDVHQFGYLDRVEPSVLIELGKNATEQVLPHIRKTVTLSNKISRRVRQAVSLEKKTSTWKKL